MIENDRNGKFVSFSLTDVALSEPEDTVELTLYRARYAKRDVSPFRLHLWQDSRGEEGNELEMDLNEDLLRDLLQGIKAALGEA